jgi:hypothetical protein
MTADALLPLSAVFHRRLDLFGQIEVVPDTMCWRFRGTYATSGYGLITVGNEKVMARRIFYEEWVGPLGEDENLILALPRDVCIGRACCNPDHVQSSMRSSLEARSPIYVAPEVTTPVARTCQKGHLMTPDNIVTESRNGRPKERCRKCRQESWRKNAAKRTAAGLHT